MSFQEYSVKEEKILKKSKQVNKYFKGLPLRIRTQISSKPEICQGQHSYNLKGAPRCMMSLRKHSYCQYSSKKRDQDGFKLCTLMYETCKDKNTVIVSREEDDILTLMSFNPSY